MKTSGTPARMVLDEIAPPGGYWPMRWAWLTGIFLPITTLRRCDRGRLGPALMTGFVALTMCFIGEVFLFAWEQAPLEFGWRGGLAQIKLWMDDWIQGLMQGHWLPSLPSTARSEMVSLFFVILALLGGMLVFSPLAAAPGKRRHVIRRVVCRGGLLWPHVLSSLICVLMLITGLERGEQWFDRKLDRLCPVPAWAYSRPTQSQPPTPAEIQALGQWKKNRAEFNRLRQYYEDQRPWWLTYKFVIQPTCVIAWNVWIWVVFVRGIGYVTWTRRSPWPALCEGCGYSLMGLPKEGQCPECGWKTAHLFEASWRRGLSWDEPYRWWWRKIPVTWWLAVRHPSALGKQMHIGAPSLRTQPVLMVTALSGFVVSVLGALVNKWIYRQLHVSTALEFDGLFPLWLTACLQGLLVMWVLSGVTLFWPLWLGWRRSPGTGNHCWPATAQAAVALGGWMLVWTVITWLGIWVWQMADELEWANIINHYAPGAGPIAMPAMLGGIVLLGMGGNLLLMRRILRGARFANH